MNTDIKKAETLKFLCLGLSYVFSFAYVKVFLMDNHNGMAFSIAAVVAAVCAIVWLELTMWQQRLIGKAYPDRMHPLETRFWELILLLLAATTYFGIEPGMSFFFMHPVVIYMVLCGTGHLLDNRSSCLLGFDLINGACRIPFANFPARIFSIYDSVKLRSEGSTEGEKKTNWITVIAVICMCLLCLIILVVVLKNLAEVDNNFMRAFKEIAFWFGHLDVGEYITTFIVSIPVGMFIFGLFQGSIRFDTGFEKRTMNTVNNNIGKVAIIPKVVFGIILSIFTVIYLIFFISQASYMFSGFFGVLPEEFTASEYAVSGFHELINVVLINFFLLSLIRLFSVKSKLISVMSGILMAESMIFASISASKIILYMSRFGYTFSRTLGLWGTVVVFVGSFLAIIYIASGKKTFAPWFWFAVLSFVAMNFIAYPFT